MIKKIALLTFLLIVSCLSTVHIHAQEPNLPVPESREQFSTEAAVNQYLNQLTPEQKSRSDSYFEGGYWIQLWNFVIEAIIAWIFLYLGLSGYIHKLAMKARNRNIQNLIYILLYFLLSFLISFPYTIYTGFIREHHYNLSNMTFSQWFSEEMLSSFLSLLFAGFLVMLIYMIMRKIINSWWIWGSAVFILFAIFVMFIAPVFISPLFNKYKPLEDGPVKEEILSLARANGVPVSNVYQFDASKQSTRISANVSGIGSTIRVSLNDNLLRNCSLPEIKSVMAHELGHYVLNHVYKLLIYISLLVIAGFALVNFIMKKLIALYGAGWRISSLSDITSLPLFIVVFALYMLLATPVINNISRVTESEADIFGLNAAREPDGFAAVSMKLSEYRKISPGRLEEFLFFDHPSGRARVTMAMKWKAENLRGVRPAAEILNYLKSLGNGTYLFGQMATWVHNENPDIDKPDNWIKKVYDFTGKYPKYACITYDFDDDPFRDSEWNNGVKKIWDRGMIAGIFSFYANPAGGRWNDTIDVGRILEPGDNPVKLNFYNQMDRMAANLQWLKDRNIPVVYTPFVESNDRYKWHAKSGNEQIIKLYRLVHDYFTFTKRLDNIIWAYHTTQGAGALEANYPGDEYVDVIGKSAYGTGLIFSEYDWAVEKKKNHGKVIWWSELGIRGESDPPRDCMDVLKKLENSFPELAGFVFWSDAPFYNVTGNLNGTELMADPRIVTLK